MKTTIKILIGIAILLYLTSCTQRTCPTYSKINIESVSKKTSI